MIYLCSKAPAKAGATITYSEALSTSSQVSSSSSSSSMLMDSAIVGSLSFSSRILLTPLTLVWI